MSICGRWFIRPMAISPPLRAIAAVVAATQGNIPSPAAGRHHISIWGRGKGSAVMPQAGQTNRGERLGGMLGAADGANGCETALALPRAPEPGVPGAARGRVGVGPHIDLERSSRYREAMSVSAKWLRVASAWVTRHRVPLAVMLGALAVGAAIWLVSPTTNKVYNFALLMVAAVAALLSATELLRGETHQRRAAKQLADLASLLEVLVSLEVGFAGQEGQVLHEVEVTPDWTDRAGPAIRQSPASRGIPPSFPRGARERASDLVALSFRVSNAGGRDPATNVRVGVCLPEGWEAYEDGEFGDPLLLPVSSVERAWWGPTVDAWGDWVERTRIHFGARTISNGTWLTCEPVWVRMPPSFSGTFHVAYTLTAERVDPMQGQLGVNVRGGQS